MTAKINYWFDTGSTRLKMRSEVPTTVDVLVIGGGIAGMSTLYWLLRHDVNAILVDQADIGFRATGRSNGVIGCPPLCGISEIEYDFIRQNNRLISNIINDEYIDCDFSFGGELQIGGNFLEEIDFDNIMHIDKKELRKVLPVPKHVEHAIYTPVTNTVNMYQLLYGLSMMCELSGHRLFGNTDVLQLEESKTNVFVHTADGNTIACKHVVVCSNNLDNFLGRDDILKKVPVAAACTHMLSAGHYPFLSVHAVGDKERSPNRASIYKSRVFMDVYNCEASDMDLLSDYKMEYSWCGNVYETDDKRPLIGRVRNHPRVLLNTGHGYYGLSYSMLGGKIVADLIKRKKNSVTEKQKKLFSPNRYASKKGAK